MQVNYREIAYPLAKLGYVVVPGQAVDKSPILPWGKHSRGCVDGYAYPTHEEWDEWARYVTKTALLILDSPAPNSGMPDLAVIDCDDPSYLPKVQDLLEKTYGKSSPMVVGTGREGGGWHVYTRVPPGRIVRSKNGVLGPHTIDLKASAAYVVAPGSRHQTGKIYTVAGGSPLTRELILSLPEVDEKLLSHLESLGEKTIVETSAGILEFGFGSRPLGSGSGRSIEVDPALVVFPGHGQFAGKRLSDLLPSLQAGDYRSCWCPHHDHKSGACYVLHVHDNGWATGYCHGAGESFLYRRGSTKPNPPKTRLATKSPKSLAENLTEAIREAVLDERYQDAISIFIEHGVPGIPVSLLHEALDGLKGQDEEAARKASLQVHEARLEAKRALAAAIDIRVVAGAASALELADRLAPRVAAHLRAQGLPEPTGAPCGIGMVSQNAVTGIVLGGRLTCGRLSCPTCGPSVISRKLAAIVRMPVVRTLKNDDGSLLRRIDVGDPMGTRPIHVFEMAEAEWKTFRNLWGANTDKANPGSSSNSYSEYREKHIEELPGFEDKASSTYGEGSYAVFQLPGARIAVLATRPLMASRKTLRRNFLPIRVIEDEASLIETVIGYGLQTYRVGPPAVEGGEHEVSGKVSASQGRSSRGGSLLLDPAELVDIARGSPWVALGRASPEEARARMEQAGLTARPRLRADGALHSVQSSGWVDPDVAAAIATGSSPKKAGNQLNLEEILELEMEA